MPGKPTTSDENPVGKGDGKEYTDTKEVAKPGDQTLVAEQVKGKSPAEMAVRWERELQAAKKELAKFHRLGKKINAKYLDERDGAAYDNADSKFNLFWSNIEVLKASLYAKPPNVDVSNTHKDSEDDQSRVAGNILQRMLNNDCEDDDESTYPEVTRQAVGDYLVVGLGQVWYRYEVETAENETPPVTDPATGALLAEPVKYEAITNEEAPADYVYWEDFWWSPARVWQDVRWVARRVFMTREELCERFGDRIGKEIPVTKGRSKGDALGVRNDPWEKAAVFEIWDKQTKCAYWHVLGFHLICDYKPDPLKLKTFFPCPQPLMANLTTTAFLPRADYLLAQDQYQQIDELTTRIKYLTKACKVVGVYDKNSTPIGRVFTEGMENQMIPVDNWAAFAEKGGLKGQMDFVPIEIIASVIESLTGQRDIIKGNLYEVLGIGDIMRGMTDPDETLGAQQLKAQFGGNRLQFKQQAIGAWVASGQRIKAQIICDRFQPQTIMDRSNIMHSPDAPLAQDAVGFLKSPDNTKFYRISVEAETMAMVDWAQERDSRTQFMQAVGSFVQSITPLIQTSPEAAPVVMQMLKWGLGGFRVSKEIETVLDAAIAAASQADKGQQEPSPQEKADVAKTESEATKNKTQSVKNLAQAGMHHIQAATHGAQALLSGMAPPGEPPPGPGGMPMQPPPHTAPLQPAPMQGAPIQ
jgi:hypothetical protein